MITFPNEAATPLIILLVVVLPIAFLVWVIVLRIIDWRKLKDPKSYIDDIDEDTLEYAWVMGKDCRIIQTGSYVHPSHHDAFIVLFQMQDGTEKELEVPEQDFSLIHVNDRGTLMTQNGRFIGFNAGIADEE